MPSIKPSYRKPSPRKSNAINHHAISLSIANLTKTMRKGSQQANCHPIHIIPSKRAINHHPMRIMPAFAFRDPTTPKATRFSHFVTPPLPQRRESRSSRPHHSESDEILAVRDPTTPTETRVSQFATPPLGKRRDSRSSRPHHSHQDESLAVRDPTTETPRRLTIPSKILHAGAQFFEASGDSCPVF